MKALGYTMCVVQCIECVNKISKCYVDITNTTYHKRKYIILFQAPYIFKHLIMFFCRVVNGNSARSFY